MRMRRRAIWVVLALTTWIGCGDSATGVHDPMVGPGGVDAAAPSPDAAVAAPDASVPPPDAADAAPPPPPPRRSPIAAENALPGSAGWQLAAADSNRLAAWTTPASVEPGATVSVHAAAPQATTANWELWRPGAHGALGG